MVTLCYCLDDNPPVVRFWPYVPRIGETVTLPELGGKLNTLKVVDVICEGLDEPSITVYLHHVRREHNGAECGAEGSEVAGR